MVTKSCEAPAPDFDFTLQITSVPGAAVTESMTCDGNLGFTLDAAQQYDLTEADVDDWELTSADCTASDGVIIADIAGGVHITTPAGAGIEVSCTFENESTVPDTGSITIVKDTNPETSSPTFDFDSDLGDIDLADDESQTFSDLPAGSYTVTENEPDGWELVSIDCGDVDLDVIVGAADADVNLGAETVVIDLAAGEDITCTFTNEQTEPDTGTIVIEKDVSPEPDSTDFTFSDNIPGCTIGTLDDDGLGGLSNAVTCSNVNPGDYEVTENGSPLYVLDSIVCNDNGNTSVSVASATAFIDLDPGETVYCLFTNVPTDQGTITIIKDTNPETSGIYFDFDGDLGDFDLSDGDYVTFTNLSSDSYTVTENEPSGWDLIDITCDSGDVAYSGNSVTINLDFDEDVTCTFVNDPATNIPQVTPTPKPPVIVVPTAPTQTPVVIPSTPRPIAPPSAGDAGLLDNNDNVWVAGILSIVIASGTALLFFRRSEQD
jgi:hypothetical protein